MSPQKRQPKGIRERGRFVDSMNPESSIVLSNEQTSSVGSWPKSGQEQAVWTPDPTAPHSKSEIWEQTGPYLRSIPAFIVNAKPEITVDQFAEMDDLSQEIVRFDIEMGSELGPYGAVLLRSEAMSSSRIEQITDSARAIATAETGLGKSMNAELIVANTRAMQSSVAAAGTLDEKAILATHKILMEVDDPKIAGQWRQLQNWIDEGNAGPRLAVLVPPDYQRIPELMSDLVLFMRRTDIPVLVTAALAHAQFESIHPFVDGNGRTGRALIHAILRQRSLTNASTVPVSAGLLIDTGKYFDALTQYRSGDTDPMVTIMTSSTRRALFLGRELVGNLRTIRSSWDDRIKVRKGAGAWRLADVVVAHPVLTRELVAQHLNVKEDNVHRSVGPFVDAGILIESGSDVRGRRVWRSPEVLDELDNFGIRLGRRTGIGH
jgi:Fic family protein